MWTGMKKSKEKPTERNKTSGDWNPKESFCYFMAGPYRHVTLSTRNHGYSLLAINEIMSADWQTKLDKLLATGTHVLIDSGAFAIASSHAKKHFIPLEEAFRLPLDKLDGFNELLNRYLEVGGLYQDKAWGMVEIDLGGETQKRKTRRELEAKGLRPIPVFHPLGDSPEYLDELFQNYDRICIGNMVNTSRFIRKHILMGLKEKLKQYPDTWIHLLGVTPSELLCAFPIHSCDSSAWQNTIRWAGYVEKTCLKSIGHLPKNYQYKLGEENSWEMGVQMGAVGSFFQQENFRNYLKSFRREKFYVPES